MPKEKYEKYIANLEDKHIRGDSLYVLTDYYFFVKDLIDELDETREGGLKKGSTWAVGGVYRRPKYCLEARLEGAKEAIFYEASKLAEKYL